MTASRHRREASPAAASELAAAPPARWSPAWFDAHFRVIMAVLLGVACLARLVMLIEYTQRNVLAAVPINDAETYWQWAQRIAAGQWTLAEPFYSAPLYPYLLGVLRGLGAELVAVYLLQIVLSLMTAAVLAWTARPRFGALVAVLAAALLLLLNDPASFSLRILATTVQLLLATLTWAALVRFAARPAAARAVAAGAALGLFCLSYAPALLILLLWGAGQIGWWLREPRRLMPVAGALVVACVVIAPATVHNWRASGTFLPVRGGSGINLRIGNQPDSVGTYTPLPGISIRREQMFADAAQQYEAATGEAPTHAAVDAYFRGAALQEWANHPLWAAGLALRKLYWFFTGWRYGDIYQPMLEVGRGLTWSWLLAPLPAALLMGAAVLALLGWLRRPAQYAPEWLLLLAPLVVAVVFFYSPRFRAPALPMLALAAAWSIAQAWPAATRRSWTLTLAGVTAVVAVLMVVNAAVGFDTGNRSALALHLAYAYDHHSQPESAVTELEAALARDPDRVDAELYLAGVLSRLNRRDDALAHYRRATELEPNTAEAWAGIGRSLCALKRFDEAEPALRQALDLQGDAPAPGTLGLLAAARQALGAPDEAEALLRQAVALEPDATPLRTALGGLLLQQSRLEDARTVFDRVLKDDPRSFDAHQGLGLIAIQQQRRDDALQHLQAALNARPGHVAVLRNLGLLHAQLGEFDQAEQCFQAVLQRAPQDPQALEALRRVQTLRSQQPAQP